MDDIGWYDRLLSSFGYDALVLLFGIKIEDLTELQLRQLVRLGGLAQGDAELELQIKDVLQSTQDGSAERTSQLLNLLRDPKR